MSILKDRNNFRFSVSLLLIVAAHLLFLLVEFNLNHEIEKKPRHIIIKLNPDPFKNKTQIVESDESDSDKKMDDAYLSDKDRFFNRETQARRTKSFQSAGKKNIKLSDLGMQKKDDPYRKAAQKYSKAKSGDAGSDPNPKVSSTSDYLKDVPLGDLTELNTTEYKYYGFYYRIKQKLEQFWGRSLHEKANDLLARGRGLASKENFITALEITLDHEGEIVSIKIRSTSGIRELDDAAIDSFNQAGPFPNPPKGMIVSGRVKLEWGFVVRS